MIKAIFDALEKFAPPLLVLSVVFGIALIVALAFGDGGTLFVEVLGFIVLASPVWLPIVLMFGAWGAWMDYIQTKAFYNIDYVVLEVRLPEEITQSPAVMENVLNAFFQTGVPKHFIEAFWQGKTRPQSSLELVSLEGRLYFFVRCPRDIKNVVEAHFYAHYPTVEIQEVPDYMDQFEFDLDRYAYFALEQKLQKPDPYPIKTYVAFGLDKEQEEEYKNDPINTVLETLGSVGKGEYAMMQIVIRAHQAEKHKPGTWFGTEDWKEEAKRERDKIVEELRVTKKEADFVVYRPPTEDEKELLEAMGRNITKKPFDTGIRQLYIAEKGADRSMASPFATALRTFESHNLNGFKPVFVHNFKYDWWGLYGRRGNKRKKEQFDLYKARGFFTPFDRPNTFVLSSEELATIWHLPGRVAQTPSLGRIPSRRAEAPPNLPV